MAILNFGDHLPPVYLERFNPPQNQVTRISVLATQAVGIEAHWVDLPQVGIKGMFRCTGGVCCSTGAFGRRSQYYHVPVYVYSNPTQSAEGQLMDWGLTKTIYDQLVTLAQRYNILEYDLDVTKVVQGQGTRTNFTLVPDVKLRGYWTPEQKKNIEDSVKMFFSIAETTLVQDATDQTYQDMLLSAGYDFNTKTFPTIGAPAHQGSNVAISSVIQKPAGISGSTNITPALGASSMPQPAFKPQQSSVPQSSVPQSSVPQSSVPQQSTATPSPIGVATPNSSFPQTNLAPQPTTVNEIPQAKELTAADIDALLND